MLKILVVNDVFPHIRNSTTILIENIVPLIKKKLEVKVFWVITDNYGERTKVTDPNYEVFYLSDYKNAREILEKIKPDLCYHLVGANVPDYAFMLVERHLKIPNFGLAAGWGEAAVDYYFKEEVSGQKVFLEHIRQFFEKKNVGYDNGIKTARGKNFLKKCLFLIRTLRSIGKSNLEANIELLELAKLQFRPPNKFNKKFNCNLIFIENNSGIDFLVKSGLKRENIRTVGNPIFHTAFKKRTQISLKDNNKLNILFITANLTSGQGKSNFSKSRRNKMIEETITSLNKFHKKTSLVIKIHPTAENYTEYKQLLEKFENIHLSQKDDIIDLINKSDVIITPVTSTAAIIALIMNKPIIIWNYFHIEQDLLLRTDTALECKNISELNNCLDSAESFREKNAEKINNIIDENFSYENPSQRIADEILDFIRKHNPRTN
ncbi:uncharacterized protein METZ01_LOCUS205297 [marine metagenome]|uniref:UDP-N-acetylglucosamine 2-epimerase domain-containing protein n=1 Tax=marine metagenome TaxID=408172 RepID=A0A382ER45_9ZZZZ